MSKNIESIIIATRNDELSREETKAELKTLFLEIIGEDDDWDSEIRKYQSELRQKVEEL